MLGLMMDTPLTLNAIAGNTAENGKTTEVRWGS